MGLAAMQRSAPSGPGLALLRRDASTAWGSPGRSAAVARRRCRWSQMGARRCPARLPLVRALGALASRPWRPATPRGAEKNEVRLPPTLFATPSPRLGERVSKSRLFACSPAARNITDRKAAARLLAHGEGSRARSKRIRAASHSRESGDIEQRARASRTRPERGARSIGIS